MPTTESTVIEAFLVDPGFSNQTHAINDILTPAPNKVATLTSKSLAYFTTPSVYQDVRLPAGRAVNWSAESIPQLVIDDSVFGSFVSVINAQSSPVADSFFALLDMLFFNYTPGRTHSQIETDLLSNAAIAEIYVPGSFSLASQTLNGTVYRSNGGTNTVAVPTRATFQVTLPSGSTSITYTLTVFTSVDAFLLGYTVSSIVAVIPPLTYETIYTASLVTTNTNVFSTAATTATLNYNTTKALLGTVAVSGISEYSAILTDTLGNSVPVPFNILYKGRAPILTEIREAIRAALLASGIGDEAGWHAKFPGVFIVGRFYLIPLWDQSYAKPDEIVFPSLVHVPTARLVAQQVLDALGISTIGDHLDLLPVYYNTMTTIGVPDGAGIIAGNQLSSLIPDYQSYPTETENFFYMSATTQSFAKQLNAIIALDNTNGTSPIYTPLTENLLTFYSFVINSYELCVITKACYTDLRESSQ